MKLEWPIDAQQAKMERENEEFVARYLASKDAELARNAVKDLDRLRASHDALLEAAKKVLLAAVKQDTNNLCMLEFRWLASLEAAVAKAEEPAL